MYSFLLNARLDSNSVVYGAYPGLSRPKVFDEAPVGSRSTVPCCYYPKNAKNVAANKKKDEKKPDLPRALLAPSGGNEIFRKGNTLAGDTYSLCCPNTAALLTHNFEGTGRYAKQHLEELDAKRNLENAKSYPTSFVQVSSWLFLLFLLFLWRNFFSYCLLVSF